MDQNTLLEEVSDLAFGYFMAGELDPGHLVAHLNPESLPARFDDYERIVDLRLALDRDMVEFIEDLDRHLRRIKTETQTKKSRDRDAIKGHVDWSETYQERHSRAPRDRTLFVTMHRTEQYDIPENLVLKKLLSIVHETLAELEGMGQSWLDTRWGSGDVDSITEFRRLYRSNVHLNRIETPEPPKPTDRMIQTTKVARQEFYRTAANYLEWRQNLRMGNEGAIEKLYDSSVIRPSRDRLLELFVVLKLINVVETEIVGEFGSVRRMPTGGDALARIGDPPIYIYHDSSAKDRQLTFPSAPEFGLDEEHKNKRKKDEWLRRESAIEDHRKRISKVFWGTQSGWTNRPDAILFRPAPGAEATFASEILIIEVKDSTRRKTINRGIRELLEYIAFATKSSMDEFLFPETSEQDAFGEHIHGLLVIQDLAGDYPKGPIDGPIQILQANQLETDLEPIVQRLFGPPAVTEWSI